MKINHYLRIDLANPGLPPRLQVTQDDSGSHVVTIQLKEQGHPWFIPPDAAVLVHFRKSDRTGGVYDTLPNGSAAWDAVGNELQIILAPQVLTAPGETALAVTLIQGDNRLTVAKIVLQVAPCPGFAGISESYSYVSAFIPQPRSAAPGQLLQVKEVNELGVVLSTEAVNGVNGELIQIDSFNNTATWPWGNGKVDGTVSYLVEVKNCFFTGCTIAPAIGNHSQAVIDSIRIHDNVFEGFTSSRGAVNFQSAKNVDVYCNTFTGCTTGITIGTADNTNTVHDNRFIGITTVSGNGIHSYNNMVNGTFTP